ncbi:NADH-quinone oxidoreductase subunit NuoB [Pseudoroseomonas cervicalis]|nr:NADH-quinone oxidoreductase subunit NuoB [Pseudoroseomonas cervicalis]WBV44641.1 NADH-quinone oxidoreductase subunit NuoB [Pseudoroseomonas cervicalis]
MLRSLARRPLTGPAPAPQPETVAALAERLQGAARRRLGRSLAIRTVDAGSCNGCELEIAALQGVVHDLERFGLRFVASPRHADVLLVTGPMTRAMTEAAQRAHACMADPSWVVAVGDCALGGGVFAGSYAVEDGIGAALPVDLVIPGCPPSPALLLEGLLTLVEVESGALPPEPPPLAPPEAYADPAEPPPEGEAPPPLTAEPRWR